MPRTISEHYNYVFQFIVDYKLIHDGNSPSYREIMDGCKIKTTSMVTYALDRLEEAGKITRPIAGSGVPRQISIPGGQWTYQKGKRNVSQSAA
jgi:hypothetical protein